MSEGHDLWGAIGDLHRTRQDLVRQLASVVREGETDRACSFCLMRPPFVIIVPGPAEACICDRCVDLCREILLLASERAS